MGDLREMMQARRAEHTLATLRRQAAQRETRTADTVVVLPLADITVDGRVQVRVAGLDAETVAAYATVFAEGGRFPPVVVFRDERDGALYLADGFHRVAAARKAGLTEIAAEVRPGGLAGAVEYAEEANLEHGKPLSTRDKRAIFERRVARGHEWAHMSDREIARQLGVDPKTIGNWRKALSGVEFSTPAPEKRIGADGKIYDVRNIQAAAKQRAASKPTADYERVTEYQGEITALLANSPLDYQTIRTRLGIRQDDRASLSALRVAMDRLLGMGAVRKEHGAYHLVDPNPRVQVKDVYEQQRQRAASKPTPRYVADPDVDQRVAEDDETPAATPPRPPVTAAHVRANDEEVVRRLADRLEAAIGELLRDSPLPMSGLLAGLRGARLDVDSQVGLAALRVALNRLLDSGQVVRAGDKYWWYSPDEDETEEPEATAALELAVGAMDELAAALDNVLVLSVSDQAVLRDPAVRRALGALWDGFPPLREKLTQAEERVEALLRQSIDGIMGGLA